MTGRSLRARPARKSSTCMQAAISETSQVRREGRTTPLRAHRRGLTNRCIARSKAKSEVDYAGMTAFSAPILTCNASAITLGKHFCRGNSVWLCISLPWRSPNGSKFVLSPHRSIVDARWRQKCDHWRPHFRLRNGCKREISRQRLAMNSGPAGSESGMILATSIKLN